MNADEHRYKEDFRCLDCGYDLRGQLTGIKVRCPECGNIQATVPARRRRWRFLWRYLPLMFSPPATMIVLALVAGNERPSDSSDALGVTLLIALCATVLGGTYGFARGGRPFSGEDGSRIIVFMILALPAVVACNIGLMVLTFLALLHANMIYIGC